MVAAQKRALDELWHYYGISEKGPLELDSLFGRQAPRQLEIGFGMGDALLEMALAHPEKDYLGIEVHLPGVGRLLQRLREKNITNIRIDRRDALEVLDQLPAQSIERMYLLFPDPWTKSRHQKRRIVQIEFIQKIKHVLEPGGLFHTVTDSNDYAKHIIQVIESTVDFTNQAGSGNFHPRPTKRPFTKFERRSVQQGNTVRDLIYKRI